MSAGLRMGLSAIARGRTKVYLMLSTAPMRCRAMHDTARGGGLNYRPLRDLRTDSSVFSRLSARFSFSDFNGCFFPFGAAGLFMAMFTSLPYF